MHTSVKFQRLAISLAAVMLVTTFPTAASAQAFFNKLAEKAAQKLAPAQPKPGEISADDARQIEQDKADKTLDQRLPKADRREISGLYYAAQPMGGLALNHERAYGLGKFLIEYSDDTGMATLYTRFSFEANDPAKLVPKAVFGTSAQSKSRTLRALAGSTHFLMRDASPEARTNYKYGQMSYKTDLQHNEVPDKLLPQGLESLLLLEPGVVYVGPPPFAGDKTRPYGHNLLRPGFVLPLLYKEGKAEAAKAWTAEKIAAEYRAAMDAFDKAFEETAAQADPNLALREPSSDLPSMAELEAAKVQWARVIKDRNVADTQKTRSFTLVYTYPATGFENMTKKQVINNSYVDTIVSRSRVYVAVCQDQDKKYWTHRFYLVEKAPPGVFFGERWSGQYDHALPASAVPVAVAPEAALKYQGFKPR